MNDIVDRITSLVARYFRSQYNTGLKPEEIQLQYTRKEFKGDLTLVIFPLAKYVKKSPEDTARELGVFLKNELDAVDDFNIIKGFLNLRISYTYWLNLWGASAGNQAMASGS